MQRFCKKSYILTKTPLSEVTLVRCSDSMSRKVSGFCLTCKTYGEIVDCQLDLMKNGRTRAHGFCSQEGCTGKISKIVS